MTFSNTICSSTAPEETLSTAQKIDPYQAHHVLKPKTKKRKRKEGGEAVAVVKKESRKTKKASAAYLNHD